MLPILFSVGAIDVRANTTFFILGCLVGLWVGWKEVKRQTSEAQLPFEPKRILVFFAVFLPFVYLIGMVGAWLFHWNMLMYAPSWQKFAFSGWISYGGIVGALVFGACYPNLFNDHSARTPDIVALVLPIFEGVYRIGCLLNGCCYGKETDGFGGIFLRNEWGVWARRYPTQILYILLGFGLFALLWSRRKKSAYEGELVVRYLMWYGLGRFLIDWMRVSGTTWGWLTIYQVLDVGLLVLGIILWRVLSRRKKAN